MKPTNQQQAILDYSENCVVIASPGSGKTFVLSNMIKANLSYLKEHQGLIAISYTNKASNELRNRSLSNGENPLSSFFGTIDRFYISEIVIPFGKHVFGIPKDDFDIITIDKLPEEDQNNFSWFNRDLTLDKLTSENIDILGYYFKKGIVLLETTGVFSNYIFDNSIACQKYLRARYKYLYIDEYQDSGHTQHDLFLKISKLGITSVAVGDLNQSIYAFSGKSSRFLDELNKSESFKSFTLNKNHRCHPSIINYSNYFLNKNTNLLESKVNNVCFFRIEGNEISISKWINQNIDTLINEFKVSKKNNVALLVRGERTGNILNNNLTIPHKYSITNELDSNLNIWSGIFSNLLFFVHDSKIRFIEVVEAFKLYDSFKKIELETLNKRKKELIQEFNASSFNSCKLVQCFIKIAEIIAPNSKSQESIDLLNRVVTSATMLDSYKPAADDEVQIMTLHKSKGLEFELVVHLDLYKWILPNEYNEDPAQDINLHYVGITRAIKACILISSTKRTRFKNGKSEQLEGADSPFIWNNEIDKLRRFSLKGEVKDE
ncbi:ATP-dependent helicase [uncultured Zobellia sp.]|uniref:UvrD-helicase domain-containing protein n=1 Tax=uncultured Zobellia sp. TaxID=255433 RepID=UPI002597A219|nr:ATP-dependent helicase [uncultured Zobellia sp.]